MSDVAARAVERRYLVLTVLRWLPTGLLIPVMVLLLTERGFSLGAIGAIGAVQGRHRVRAGAADRWPRRRPGSPPGAGGRHRCRSHRGRGLRVRPHGLAARGRAPAGGRLPGAGERTAQRLVRRCRARGRSPDRHRARAQPRHRRAGHCDRRRRPGRRWACGARSCAGRRGVGRAAGAGRGAPRRRDRCATAVDDRGAPAGGLVRGAHVGGRRAVRRTRGRHHAAVVACAAVPGARRGAVGLRHDRVRDSAAAAARRGRRRCRPGGRAAGTDQFGGVDRVGARRRGRAVDHAPAGLRGLGGRAADRAGRDGRGDGPRGRPGRCGGRVPRDLLGARRVEPGAPGAAARPGRPGAPRDGAVGQLDDEPVGRRGGRHRAGAAGRHDRPDAGHGGRAVVLALAAPLYWPAIRAERGVRAAVAGG